MLYYSLQAGLICVETFALGQFSLGREEDRSGRLMFLRLLCWLHLWKEVRRLESYTLQNSLSLYRACERGAGLWYLNKFCLSRSSRSLTLRFSVKCWWWRQRLISQLASEIGESYSKELIHKHDQKNNNNGSYIHPSHFIRGNEPPYWSHYWLC